MLAPQELVDRLSESRSLAGPLDAMLYQQIVDATGGPDTLWAKHVKAAARDEADPLRQRHRSAMRQRTEDRDRQLVEILRTQPKRTVARDREVAKLFDDQKLETFVTWATREKHRLDAEWEARAQVAKVVQPAGMSMVEQLRADARAVDESIRRDKIAAAEAAQRELHARNLTIARAACVPIEGTKAAEYLAGRGLRVGNAALFSANWPQGVANDAGKVTKGFGPAVVFDFKTPAGAVVAAQGRYLDPPVFDGKPFKVWTVGALGESVFWTPGARESGLVTITEAPIDALSVFVATGVPAIALGGTQNQPAFLTEVLAGRKVVLALDSDVPGITATAKLETLLQRSEMTRLKMPPGLRGAIIKDVSEALQSVPDALRYAVQAATTRLGMQLEIEQPRRRGISDDDLAAAIERAQERKAQEAVDIALVQRIRHELRGLGVRDEKLPSREDVLAQLPELRKATAQRNDFAGSNRTEAERIARALHERGRSHGMSR